MWRLGQLTLAPNLREALSYRMPAFTDSRIFPTHNLKIAGVNIKLYSIKFGRLYQISPDPVAVTREWAHITPDEGAWRRAWKSWPRRPSESKQKILRWRLQHKSGYKRAVTNIFVETNRSRITNLRVRFP
ncbi:uncharacterized protein VTP21DRAFT_6193 [Calcarisporiella thermophila]|uniref:uncharacterized protein n=1 Tax=Calcarisporiella thermophila TaxID=911321 RepID=UPI003742ECD0